MIRLFVTDIDGCLATPYRPFRLDVLSRLRDYAREAGLPGSHSILPAFSLCSGRAYPYVEAMSQLLALTAPVLFESGAGMFDPLLSVCRWHPDFDDATSDSMKEVKMFMDNLVQDTVLSVDRAKRSQVAIVAPGPDEIQSAVQKIDAYVHDSHPSFKTFHTSFSVDVVAPHLTKRSGIAWLAEWCGIEMAEIAFVGDSNGDIGALKEVGRSYAPANADTEVKEIVHRITNGSDADGVFEAYLDVLQFNEKANRDET